MLISALILTFLVGLFSARLYRLVSVDRITQAPRYRIVRWLDKKRAEGSLLAYHALLWGGCFECSPVHYSLWAWLGIWSQTSIPMPGVVVPFLTLASTAVSRWVIRQVGWEGKTVVLEGGRQAVVGVRDFPPGVAFPPQKGAK